MWRRPGETKTGVWPTVRHGGGRDTVWGREGTMDANIYCEILKQSTTPSLQKQGGVAA